MKRFERLTQKKTADDVDEEQERNGKERGAVL
jgi:hypothetical protein